MDRRLLLLVLPGCFHPYQDMPALDFTEMVFDRPGLETSSAVVRAFDLETHTCPDGEPARVYALYSEEAAENAPVAVVLHSGAFDYIVSYEDGQEPLPRKTTDGGCTKVAQLLLPPVTTLCSPWRPLLMKSHGDCGLLSSRIWRSKNRRMLN